MRVSRIFDLLFFIIAFIRYFVLQRDGKGTALSELALYLYGSTKQVHTYLFTMDIPSPVPAILLLVVFFSRVKASKILVR